MIFHIHLSFTLTVIILNLTGFAMATNRYQNKSAFIYQNIDECARGNYYNLQNFSCVPCDRNDEHLQPTKDKFSCECDPSNFVNLALLYDTTSNKKWPTCVDLCNNETFKIEPHEKKCDSTSIINCKLKYLNKTQSNSLTSNRILMSTYNLQYPDNCSHCDLQYNFQYNGYCIGNALVKPYLHYNAYWQWTQNTNTHLGELKYVAFFCLALRNDTACQHLANLCVMSYFSIDKHAPCSAFWLAQASDMSRYAGGGMTEQLRATVPSLFYKKSKQTAESITKPIDELNYVHAIGEDTKTKKSQYLQFFSTIYALDGTLSRWGIFSLNHVDLCGMHRLPALKNIRFGQRYEMHECQLTLENLIDLAHIYGNNNFLSLFLNFTTPKSKYKVLSIPILIEDLIPENKRNQPADWQLVKRFQLIEVHPRHFAFSPHPSYMDAHKLQMYHKLRYIEHFQLHYTIHAQNSISLPLVRLRYRQIEMDNNATLEATYRFRLEVSFDSAGATDNVRQWWTTEAVLPIMLFCALTLALLRAYNSKRRRRGVVATNNAEVDHCDVPCMGEFLLQFISYTANTFLFCYVLHIVGLAVQYYTQHTVQLTLPLMPTGSHADSLNILIYAALALKFIFCCVHFWRISHFDLFFIDWERPKCCGDNNHFQLKSNLETSSVCSSVRTYSAEHTISAWRMFFMANEWLRLSCKQRISIILQGLIVLIMFKLLDTSKITQEDETLKTFILVGVYVVIFTLQLVIRTLLINAIYGNPLQQYVDLCSLANISVLTLLECTGCGYYIHGRSPHGFADTDMSAMLLQLQRESQNMCGRRGLLSDSDQQTYVVVPPVHLRTYFGKLLLPLQRSNSISQAHFQKEIATIEGNLERNAFAYGSVNRFFCAFIDHSIKDLDYIIKEKTFIEQLFDCEFGNNYFSETKGTFYIDKSQTFARFFLYGNQWLLFTIDLLLLLCIYRITKLLEATLICVCLFQMILRYTFRAWNRQNIATKTLIDKRFLI